MNIKKACAIGCQKKLCISQVVFGRDGAGRPTMNLRQCLSNIGGVSVNFHGGGERKSLLIFSPFVFVHFYIILFISVYFS